MVKINIFKFLFSKKIFIDFNLFKKLSLLDTHCIYIKQTNCYKYFRT